MSSRVLRAIAAAVVVAALPLLIGAGGAGGQSEEARAEHQRIVDFWTGERVAQAVPRDFYRNPNTGRFTPAKKPVPPDPGTGYVSGASWTGGGDIVGASGKVLFEMDGSYWICSATAIEDPADNLRSLIITAGHCVYDETNGEFATNWMFIPAYDLAPEPLDADGSFCAATEYGCWTAAALVVAGGYATAGGFNDQAVVHDFAVVAVEEGGKTGQLLDEVVSPRTAAFSEYSGGDVHAFGYPAERKWDGSDLIYCLEPLGTDPLMDGATYRLSGCLLNGGSSGGPWLYEFSNNPDAPVMSVNSYSYRGIKAMHGPIFNADTQAVYDAALIAIVNTTAEDVVP